MFFLKFVCCLPVFASGAFFKEWLPSIQVTVPPNLPPISLNISSFQIDVLIISGTCDAIRLEDFMLNSTGVPDKMFGSTISIDGFGISCDLETQTSIQGAGYPMAPLRTHVKINPSSFRSTFEIEMASQQVFGDMTAMLPRNFSLLECNLLPNVELVFHCESGPCKLMANVLDRIIQPFLADADSLGRMICDHKLLIETAVGAFFGELNFKILSRHWLKPSTRSPEPHLTDASTDIEKLMLTGVAGHVLQTIIHDGAVDMTNTSALLSLGKRLPAVLGFDIDFDNLPQHENGALELPFGSLSFDLSLPTCDEFDLPSPLSTANVTKHSLTVAPSPISFKNCGTAVDLTFTSNSSSFIALPLTVSPRLSASLDEATAQIALLLGIDGNFLSENFALDQQTHVGCLRQALDSKDPVSLRLLGMGASFDAFELRLADGSDALLDSILQGVSVTANMLVKAFGPTALLALKGVAMDDLRDTVNELIQGTFDKDPLCPASAYFSPVPEGLVDVASGWTAFFGVWGLALGVFVLAACGLGLLRRIEKRMPRQALAEAAMPGARSLDPADAAAHTGSLASHPAVSRPGGRALTLLAVANVGLMLVGVFGLQMQILITLVDSDPEGGGPHAQVVDKTLDVTVWRLAMILTDLGCWPLTYGFLLIAAVLPLCQSLALIAVWHAPLSVLSAARRKHVVQHLWLQGKLAPADSLAMAILLGGLGFGLTAERDGTTSTIATGSFPQYALFVAFGSQVLTMSIREAMLRADRRVEALVGGKKAAAGQGEGRGESFLADEGGVESASTVGHGQQSLRRRTQAPLSRLVESNRAVQGVTWVCLSLSPLLVIIGVFVQSWSFTWGGLFGALKLALNDGLTTQFSVVSLLVTWPWPTGGSFDDAALVVGTLFLLCGMAWFLVLAPMLQAFCMLILWALPMTDKRQRDFHTMANILFTWQLLDVCVVLLCLILLFRTQLSSLLCALIDTESSLAPILAPVPDEIEAMSLTAGFEPGLIVLILALVCQTTGAFLLDWQAKKVLAD